MIQRQSASHNDSINFKLKAIFFPKKSKAKVKTQAHEVPENDFYASNPKKQYSAGHLPTVTSPLSNDTYIDMVIGHRVNRVHSLKRSIKYMATQMRYKSNEAKYFGKIKHMEGNKRQQTNYENEAKTNQSVKKLSLLKNKQVKQKKSSKKLLPHFESKKQQQKPEMLQCRTTKKSRLLRIIQSTYNKQLVQISEAKLCSVQRYFNKRDSMLKKLKNSQVYYKMIAKIDSSNIQFD